MNDGGSPEEQQPRPEEERTESRPASPKGPVGNLFRKIAESRGRTEKPTESSFMRAVRRAERRKEDQISEEMDARFDFIVEDPASPHGERPMTLEEKIPIIHDAFREALLLIQTYRLARVTEGAIPDQASYDRGRKLLYRTLKEYSLIEVDAGKEIEQILDDAEIDELEKFFNTGNDDENPPSA